MPMRGNLADAKDFAQRHGAWLAERLRRLPDGVAFVDGASPAAARRSRIASSIAPRARGTVWLRMRRRRREHAVRRR